MMAKGSRSRRALTPAEVETRRAAKAQAELHAKAVTIGIPLEQLARGDFVEVDVKLSTGEKVTSYKTLANRGGTPIARWKAAKLLSETQLAAITYCENLWGQLNGKSLVMDYGKVIGGTGGNGWAEQEALDDLHRIKGYIPMKWWSIFESVCRFDEPAGFAGSRITDCANDQVSAARTTVQFVADVIAMKERLSG
jgi:hypothetical protein